MQIPKKCTICNKDFLARQKGQNVCSWPCKIIRNRENAIKWNRDKRHKKPKGVCFFCKYNKAIDNHHENGKQYTLCPNCHALLSRGYKTFEELLAIKI